MPSITAPAKILITGVNSYVGAHVAQDLLDRGFTVVGTVRSSSKGDDITRCFIQYGDRFSYTIVEDISQPTAFDKLLSTGKFDGVAHVAAPVPRSSSSASSKDSALQEIFNASAEGNLNLLRSIKAHGHTIKRVVITSSAFAALQFQPGVKHTEAHWNDESVRIVEEKGETATPLEHYAASKSLAERAAWKFMEDNQTEVNFDLVTVLPVSVIGAPIDDKMPHEQLGNVTILFDRLKLLSTETPLSEISTNIVHVKDVAALHSESFIQPVASGHRVIGAAADPSWQDIYDALNEEPAFPGVPKGNPGVGSRHDEESLVWDASFAKSLLGRNLIGTRAAVRESARYCQVQGLEFVRA
ncbi:hypothetical protein B0J17DRAFT_723064 [Rhizoctonia solani]|nr:hypothetical protein B0J17DRAFT_723064 [Rhizoctonia solani]